jgi:peptidylprolyl isomerase
MIHRITSFFLFASVFVVAGALLFTTGVVEGLAAPTKTKSGLTYVDLTEGDGPVPKSSDFVRVHYEGKIKRTGKVFGSTRGKADFRADAYKDTPFSFKMGSKQVVAGWEEGISTMKVGGKRRLNIPAALAYGDEGSPDGVIPKKADLVFDVELVSIDGNTDVLGGMALGFQIAFGLIAVNGLTQVVTGHELREYLIGAV